MIYSDVELLRRKEEWTEQDILDAENAVIRREVAAMVLQGMCSSPSYDIKCVSSYTDFAEYAVKQADALLDELDKE